MADDDNVTNYNEQRVARGLGEPLPDPAPNPIRKGPGGPGDFGMSGDERIGRLEGAFNGMKLAIDGLRHSQNMMMITSLGVGTILAAFVVGFGVYTLQRIDSADSRGAQIEREVIQLPGKISDGLRDLTGVISSAITASKQQGPQVIVVPVQPQAVPKALEK